jgi:hypothetical protein
MRKYFQVSSRKKNQKGKKRQIIKKKKNQIIWKIKDENHKIRASVRSDTPLGTGYYGGPSGCWGKKHVTNTYNTVFSS